MVDKIPEITVKMRTVVVKARTRKRKIDKNTVGCVVPVTDKISIEKIHEQLSTHFTLKGELVKNIYGTSEKIKMDGVCVDFIAREYYSLSEVDWALHQRVYIQMTPRRVKNHLKKYETAFTSTKFGL